MRHYLNNAGAAIMTDLTYNAVIEYMDREREIGPYAAAQENKIQIDGFYQNVKKLLCAKDASSIAFVDSASRGWNLIINGLHIKKGDTILTLSSEFGTNLLSLFLLSKTKGVNIRVVECDGDGHFDINEIKAALEGGVSAIAISHAAAQGSIVNPIVDIGILANAYNVKYIIDGCQGVGQIPIDVEKSFCDVYTTSGRKWLRAPRGTGFLYVKNPSDFIATEIDLASSDLRFNKETGDVIDVDVVNSAKKFELWEKSYANLIGFSLAIEQYLQFDPYSINKVISAKSSLIRIAAADNPHIKLVGDVESQSGIVGLYAEKSNEKLKKCLQDMSVTFSLINDWDCPLVFPKNVDSIIRLSPHYYTDDDTIKLVAELIGNY